MANTTTATQQTAAQITDDLVDRFASALKAKLRASEAKYGWQNAWLSDDWEADCQRELERHVAKGDPLDVATYAAFCWHHGWTTSVSVDLAGQGEQTDPIFRERAACAYLAECHTGMWDNATAEAIASAIRERDPSQDDFSMVTKEAWAAVQPVWLFLRHGERLPDDLAAKLAPAPSRPAATEDRKP